ncbi:TetR/AcrR family transcriptional regulator [Actinokineospora spheciospongiae]|uniref:TetR/AcrR family transcriptional regulator n=1 Tax=Actinokineospora spheciospongiae TaxID=909613 RepID=UPI000D71135D|nr:TetR/AcrR family transcriptional regulator [Actinokineospora spheciospongiae]PWW52214.1 TetR family transcriptional regulator [Actinokineospora spheciospongiae]
MPRPREFDEQSVLNAARDQFWTTGFAGTSMDSIAAATGLGKGSLYGAFGGKRELFHRVFNDHCTAAIDSANHRLGGDDGQAFARLTAYLLDHATACAEPSHRGCLLAKGTAELSEHDEVVSARARKTFESINQAITADLEACQRNGDIDPAADARRLAGLLLTVHRGIEALGKAGTDGSTLRGITETALAHLPRPPR